MYDLSYYEKMLREYSGTAEKICKTRWEWVKEVGAHSVLDYGSGVGWFRAWRPNGAEVESYDIGKPFPFTGITKDRYDMICMWDVFEHMEMPQLKKILSMTDWFSGTIPIRPAGTPLVTWKHYKPGEHLWHLRMPDFVSMITELDFTLVKIGYPECPPRQDILSFLGKRIDQTAPSL
jgi:hypothetical protein